MLRKILVIMLGCLLPMQASADSWFFQTQVRSGGGSMTSANMSDQRVTDGAIYRSYTSSGKFAVSVVPDNGYKIRNIVVNSTPLLNQAQEGTFSSWPVFYLTGGTDQTVTASFIATALKICPLDQSGNCASNVVGYHVTPSSVGGVTVGYKLTSPITFTYTPVSGYQITGIPGLPNDPTVTHTSLAPGGGKPVKVTFPAGYVFTQDIDLQATVLNNTPVINTIPPQNAITGAPVSLNVSTANMTGVTYTWTYVSGPGNTVSYQTVNGKIQTVVTPGPAVTLSGASSATPTFVAPAVPGQYKFTVQVNSDNNPATMSLATVNVVTSGYSAAKNQCQFCHTANKIGEANLFSNWSASAHRTADVTCGKCHIGATSGGHPGTVAKTVCEGCHFPTNDFSTHPFPISGDTLNGTVNPCITCHNQHALTVSVASAPASIMSNHTSSSKGATYVTTNIDCVKCHASTANNGAIRAQWAGSAHAAVADAPFNAYDFKTRPGCVQCHTTTGFIAYSTGKVTAAWGSAADRTKEVIACVACHSNVATGTVRAVHPVAPFAGDSYVNRDAGTSNVCMDCHSGRNNGAAITAKGGNDPLFNYSSVVLPHYLTAGGTLQGKTGYQFGQAYSFYSSNTHRTLGMGNANNTGTAGPCATCHMPVTNGIPSHTYQAVTVDGNGTIKTIASGVCANCHGSLDASALDADRVAYGNGLAVLQAMLADKGIVYSQNYPYFNYKSWGAGQAGADTMGAAYNYLLLLKEPGAYAHNGAYARKLINDSIDVLYNGSVTGSIDSAVAYLAGKNEISQDLADAVTAYAKSNACSSCHSNNTGSHPKHLATSVGCAQCHSGTAASNSSLVQGGMHLNNRVDVLFSGSGSFNATANSCSAVYCHSNGKGTFQNPVWGTTSTGCVFCHPLSGLSGAHAAHVGTVAPTAYGDTGNHSTQTEYRFGCGSCHPTDLASHRDGFVTVTLVPTNDGTLRSKNDPAVAVSGIGNTGSGITGNAGSSVVCSAAYCHSNGGVGAALQYVASPNWYGGAYTGDKCAMCHGNAPATGAHAAHAVGIHYGQIYDGSGNLLPAAGPVGTAAGHGDPAQSTTISCDLCHSATLTNNANDKNASCASCHSGNAKGTPALDKTAHLNGNVDVVFKGINVVSKAQVRPTSFGKYSTQWTRTSYKQGVGSFDTSKLLLSQGSYDAAGKSCSNIACHNGGTPNWGAKLSCVDCHSSL